MTAFLRTLALLVTSVFLPPAAFYIANRTRFALVSLVVFVLTVCVYFFVAAGPGLMLWALQVMLTLILIVVGLIKQRRNVL